LKHGTSSKCFCCWSYKIPQLISLGQPCPQASLIISTSYWCPNLPSAESPKRNFGNFDLNQALPYPKYYNTELLTLHLLKAKQEVGEVDQNEVDLYKNIDPCIATHYNKTFSGSFNIPYIGLGVGAGFFAYSSYFGFTVPTRIVLSVVPIAIDWLWRSSDARNEQKSLDFLRWVVGYRKAKCWAEVNRK
jgi:hypothetical protein